MKANFSVIPAICTDDASIFEKRLRLAQEFGLAHIDLIDDQFTGTNRVLSINDWPDLSGLSYVEAHLMVRQPLNYLEGLSFKNVARAIVHLESDFNLDALLEESRRLDIMIDWALSPNTDLGTVNGLITLADRVQIMGVVPGLTGQALLKSTYATISYIKKTNPGLMVGVDGGVTLENLPKLVEAGADYVVSTSALFATDDFSVNFRTLSACFKK